MSAVFRAAFPRIIVLDGGNAEAWKAGYGARNNFWRIKIWRDYRGRTGVLAQEYREWQRAVRFFTPALFICAGSAITGGVTGNSNWLGGFGSLLIALLLPFIFRRMREAELYSHMIEVIGAVKYDGEDFQTYLDREAGGMVRYAWLKDMSPAEIKAGMLRYQAQAREWIARHDALLRKFRNFVEQSND